MHSLEDPLLHSQSRLELETHQHLVQLNSPDTQLPIQLPNSIHYELPQIKLKAILVPKAVMINITTNLKKQDKHLIMNCGSLLSQTTDTGHR